MASWSSKMDGAGPFYVGLDVTHTRSGDTVTVRAVLKWRRDAYGYSGFNSADAAYTITVDGSSVVPSTTFNFNAPAGGSIGWTTVRTYTWTVSHPSGSAAKSILVSGRINTRTTSGGAGTVSGTYTIPRNGLPKPNPPAAPTVTSPASGVVRATWGTPANTTAFDLQYSVDGGEWGTSTNVTSPWQSVVHSDWAGKRVLIRVRARNSDETGDWSASSAVTVTAMPPDAPTASVSSPAAGQLLVEWVANSNGGKNISSYDIQYRRSTTSTWTSITGIGSTIRARTITGLVAGGTYYARVRARNPDEIGAWSSAPSTVLKASAPSAPRSVSATSPAAGQAKVSWTVPADTGGKSITRYELQRADNSSFTTGIANGSETSTSHTYGGLTPGKTYWYRVRAENPDETGPWSAGASVVVKAEEPSAPAAPTLTSDDAGEVRVTWSAPSDNGGKPITGYDLRYNYAGAWITVTGVTSGRVITGIMPGATVQVQVRAKNVDATGPYSASRSIVVQAKGPSAPRTVVAKSDQPGRAVVTWLAPSSTGGKPITGYQVQWSLSSSFSSPTTVTVTGLTATLTGLPRGETVYVRVRAVNADENGAYGTAPATVVRSGVYSRTTGAFKPAKSVRGRSTGAYRLGRVHANTGSGWHQV